MKPLKDPQKMELSVPFMVAKVSVVYAGQIEVMNGLHVTTAYS